jgi:AcrR family transcriptional regulator
MFNGMPRIQASNQFMDDTLPRRETYHHGDLREAAVDAALIHVETQTAQGVSLRAIATSLGVAHRALYNHFADKAGLLASVSARGFEALASDLESQETSTEFATAYLCFAFDRSNLYQLMMSQTYKTIAAHHELRTAADKVIALATKHFRQGSDETSARRGVMRVWMILHGGLSLSMNGLLRPRNRDETIAEILAIADLH